MTVPRHLRMTAKDKARKIRKQRERRSKQVPRAWMKLGVTLESYMEMYEAQGGKCAICGVEKPPLKRPSSGRNAPMLHVDHCHRTSKVRGLLCYSCNSKLGFVEKYLKQIVRYLKEAR